MRPEQILRGYSQVLKTGCGNFYITVNFHEDKPIEVFLNIGKAGGCVKAQTEAIGRMISMVLQNNYDIVELLKQLKGIQCHLPVFPDKDYNNPQQQEEYTIRSCSDAIAKSMQHIIWLHGKRNLCKENS